MATLTVWTLNSADGASDALATLKRLQQQQHVEVQDAAVVSWPQDWKKPGITQLHHFVGAGALGGAFWGALFGLLFLVPLLGIAIAAGFGTLVASAADIGLDDSLIKTLREKIVPGTSALLLLTSSAVTDRVLEDMQAQHGHADLIEANLTREQESRLRRTFAHETMVAAEQPSPISRRLTADS